MENSRYICLLCDDDFLIHQTIIEDNRMRCICLNCWNQIKRIEFKK